MYKVIADSSNEVDQKFLEDYPTDIVPFKLYIDDEELIDDESLDIDDFVNRMVHSSKLPRTACPSPNDFIELFKKNQDEMYVVTISSKLSGTYNSAKLAKQIYETENPNAPFIHIFDSKGASASESLVTKFVHECKKMQMSSEQLVEKVEGYINDMNIYFISESLDNLIKNGRISKWKGIIASKLKIIPIMGAEDGEIKLVEKVRNVNKAYNRLIEIMMEQIQPSGKKVVAISHVGNPERANQIQEAMLGIPGIEEVLNLKCAGLSSLYADYKGVVVAF